MGLKRRTVRNVENGTEYLYEVCMEKMPKASSVYFRDVIQRGCEGWVWIGSGTAVRSNKNGVREFCQVL